MRTCAIAIIHMLIAPSSPKTQLTAWVERCSSKLNYLSVALLENNLAGGNPLPRFFSPYPALIDCKNVLAKPIGHNISNFGGLS